MVSLLLHPAFSVRFAQRPSLDGELCSQKLFGSAEVLLGAVPPALPRASPPLALTLSFIKATCSHTGVFSQTHSISQGRNRMLNKKVPVRNGNIMRLPRSKPQDRAAHVGSPAAESSLSSSPQQQACFFPPPSCGFPRGFLCSRDERGLHNGLPMLPLSHPNEESFGRKEFSAERRGSNHISKEKRALPAS